MSNTGNGSQSSPTPPPVASGQQRPTQPVMPSQAAKKPTGLTTAGMVLGIIGLVFAFIPAFGAPVAYVAGALGVIFGSIGLAKKHGGKAIAALATGAAAIIIAIIMSAAVYKAVDSISDGLDQMTGTAGVSASTDAAATADSPADAPSAGESVAAGGGFTKAIYDSITTATSGINDQGKLSYSGGTLFADIAGQVGEPTSSSESSIGDATIVTATWSDINFTSDSTMVVLTYDKDSGQITSKNMTSF